MMDNMKDKFAQFSGISIMLVSASMTLFTDNVKIKFTKMDRLFFTNLDRII